ncbi:MAG: SIR2 family NAD-dependent protein deacylase [Campylobacterales bacterium]
MIGSRTEGRGDSIALKAKEAMLNSSAILITAGAGMGVDSGLPDFRGDEGFWKAYPPFKKRNLRFSSMANPELFYQNPSLAWGFYGHRLQMYRDTTPHIGFAQLLEIAESKKNGYFVYTSNVDGHFQKAGFSENRIVECHGSIHINQCAFECKGGMWANKKSIEIDKNFIAKSPLPTCPSCGELARPNVLMFGDCRWDSSRSDAQEERFLEWLKELKNKNTKLVIVEIGAGLAIPTIRRISEGVATRLDASLIRINPRDHEVPKGAIAIKEGGLKGIEILYKLAKVGARYAKA